MPLPKGGISNGKESGLQCRKRGFYPWVGKIPWTRTEQPTPVFLPGESHGQSSLVGYSSWGRKELDTTEVPYHARTEESIRLCILFFILLNILVLCF